MYDKNISQVDIVGRTGTNKSTVSLWFNGHVKPNQKSIRMLADFIGCRYEWLATGDGSPFPPQKDGEDYVMPLKLEEECGEYRSGPNEDKGVLNENELIGQTKDVLRSNTVYRGALASNIKAFHKAVRGEKEMEDIIIQMKMMKDQLDRMEKKIDGRISPEETEKRKILSNIGE
jgi:transcriptional regulator with XRE-family HTH domain